MHGALDRERQLARLREEDAAVAVQRSRRVLVVDDSISVRELERQLLVARGYEVTASFLERLRNFPPGVFADEFKIAVPC